MKEIIKILVVEDAPGDLFLIKYYLEELDPEGYEIESVDNLKDAHAKIERSAFDIILLDLHLPDSEGIITLKSTVQKFPNEVYIVLTGLSDEKIGLEAVKNGAQDFLVKGRITSSSLDSSIKFSYERSKLKRAVKIFGESIKVLELVHDFRVLIIDFSNRSINHSFLLPKFLNIENSLDSIKAFIDYFDFDNEFESRIEAVLKGQDFDIDIEKEGVQYNLNFSTSESLNNIVVGTLTKL